MLRAVSYCDQRIRRCRRFPTVLTECSVYASIGLVPMPSAGHPDTADAVVVGGGTVGAWCAYFLRRAGRRVVVLERGILGQGASSRAAGVVRTQGGTPEAVRLGQWSRDFYLSQHDEIGIDSGFVAQDICCRASPKPRSLPPARGWPCRPGWACRCEVREHVAFRGLSRGANRVTGGDERGADRGGAGRADRRPETRRGGQAGWHPHPGWRCPASGRRDARAA